MEGEWKQAVKDNDYLFSSKIKCIGQNLHHQLLDIAFVSLCREQSLSLSMWIVEFPKSFRNDEQILV